MMVSYKGNTTATYGYPTPWAAQDQTGTLLSPSTADPPRIQFSTGGGEEYRTYEYLFDYEVNLVRPGLQTANDSKDVEVYAVYLTFDAKANP